MPETNPVSGDHQRDCVLCRKASATLLIRAPRAAAYMAVCGPCALAAIDTGRDIEIEVNSTHHLDVLPEKDDRPGDDGGVRGSGGGDRDGRRGFDPDEGLVWLCSCGDDGAVRIRDSYSDALGCDCTEIHPESGNARV